MNDPAVLKACIPGCESLEMEGNAMRATAAIKIGPIAAKFNGKVTLSDLDPPSSYRISGEGQGGVAGFAKGGADVKLAEEDPSTTLLTYVVKAQVGGKIAQLGARLIDATSKQMADLFFDRFSAMVTAPAGVAPATIPTTETTNVIPASGVAAAPGTVPQGVPVDAAAPSAAPVGGRALAPSASPIPVDATAGPLSGTAADPSSPTRPLPNTLPPVAPTNAVPAISIFQLIPSQIFGLPLVAIIGILIYLPVFFLIFKSYVGL